MYVYIYESVPAVGGGRRLCDREPPVKASGGFSRYTSLSLYIYISLSLYIYIHTYILVH